MFVTVSTALTIEIHQDGHPVLGPSDLQLSCIINKEENDTIRNVYVSSWLNGTELKRVIFFDIGFNRVGTISPYGNYLNGRVTLRNLLSSENRTLVEYNNIECRDDTTYACEVDYYSPDLTIKESNKHSLEIQGIVSVVYI